MIRCVFKTLLCFIFCSPVCMAQSTGVVNDASLGETFAIVDQFISVSFEPVSVVLLLEREKGQVEQYKAIAVELAKSLKGSEQGLRTYIVGAAIPLANYADKTINNGNLKISIAFFLASKEMEFAATEVKTWTLNELKRNSSSTNVLLRNTSELEKSLVSLKLDATEIEQKLNIVRQRVSQIADLDEIVKLKAQQSVIKEMKSEQDRDIKQLKQLIEDGRTLQDPEKIDQYRQELYADLEEAAKVSAIADRLSQRKRESAAQGFYKKLELVKQMDNANPEQLAHEIMRLREQKKALETRLGIGNNEVTQNDF